MGATRRVPAAGDSCYRPFNDYYDQYDQNGHYRVSPGNPDRKVIRHSRMRSRTWTVADAKAKFSEVIELARSQGPQTITRNGRTAVVIVAAEEWERKTSRVGNLAEFFAGSPLRGSRLRITRRKDRPRRIDL
jgi:prevent-host-death family protein